MNFDKSKVSEYDLRNAKVGDKVIVGYCYNPPLWRFNEVTIKSVSPKRGDITLSDGSRYQKDGRKMGVGRWGFRYNDNFFEHTQENVTTINSYIEAQNGAGDIVHLFREIEKQGFKMLYDLSEEDISVLHKTMTEIFEVNENE